MKAGEWRSLSTKNINATLGALGASQTVFGFAENIEWDPVTQQLFYAGGDHNDKAWFIAYDAKSNIWRRIDERSWGHGYDHNAIDPTGRMFFYRSFSNPVIERYDISSGNWESLPSLEGKIDYISCCVGIEYFPELHGLVYISREKGANGAALLWNSRSNSWLRLGAGFPIGVYHNFAEYNPVHRVMLFGGGNPPNSSAIYRLDKNGKIDSLNPAPIPLGIQQSIVTVDPISGNFLIFTSRSEFYEYNVISTGGAV